MEKKRYYFWGIGGISMSSLAIFAKTSGHDVKGYDKQSNRATIFLKENGIKVEDKINKKTINWADIIVYSSAISTVDKHFKYAKARNKKIISRGEFLGQISKQYKNTIAIAGSHGKTTTTGLIYEILKADNKRPTLHIGGYQKHDSKNFEIGAKDYFVTEACEYHNNFLHLKPTISVTTNIEPEHLDFFKTFENQKLSFEKFKAQSKIAIENTKDFTAKRIEHDDSGKLSFSLYKNNKFIFRLHLKLIEEINVENCIYAYCVGKTLNIPDSVIKQGLENFEGISCRFETVWCKDYRTAVCDYAHHPTEISKALEAAKKVFHKKLIVVFQPHTYSRTKNFFEDFINIFKDIEVPIFYQTYPAREKKKQGYSSQQLAKEEQKFNHDTIFCKNLCKLLKILHKKSTRDEFVIIFIGAGDLQEKLYKKGYIKTINDIQI